jgi:nucleotide-binding universal stress UspA family protein
LSDCPDHDCWTADKCAAKRQIFAPGADATRHLENCSNGEKILTSFDIEKIGAAVTVKDIIVAISSRDAADPGRDYALSMASACGAHVTAATYPIVPEIPGTLYPGFAANLAKKVQDEAEASAKAARARFEQAARNAHVDSSFYGFSASVPIATTDFAARLRTADIGILTQHKTGELERVGDLFMEGALFRSGRPVIIVPRGHSGRFSTERVLIAWDGSVHATRAVAGVMPLLKGGADIRVFTVEEASKGDDFRGSALVNHLRRHGLNADIAQQDESDIPAAIIKEAELTRASLVVMGGYGHSRFREFVFGGATRLMLRKMPVPVLMAH